MHFTAVYKVKRTYVHALILELRMNQRILSFQKLSFTLHLKKSCSICKRPLVNHSFNFYFVFRFEHTTKLTLTP